MGNDAVVNARSCHLCLGNRRVGQEKKECTTNAFLPLRFSLNVIDHSPVKKTPCSCDGRRLDVPVASIINSSAKCSVFSAFFPGLFLVSCPVVFRFFCSVSGVFCFFRLLLW